MQEQERYLEVPNPTNLKLPLDIVKGNPHKIVSSHLLSVGNFLLACVTLVDLIEISQGNNIYYKSYCSSPFNWYVNRCMSLFSS